MPTWRRLPSLAVVVAVGVVAVSCSSGRRSVSSAATTGSSGRAKGTITVFAAASLTGAFTEIGKTFEAANPDANVRFNFGASSALATQVNQGAPADVFASADDANMQKVTEAG